MHTYMHTYIHTYRQTDINKYKTYILIHIHIQIYIHIHIQVLIPYSSKEARDELIFEFLLALES